MPDSKEVKIKKKINGSRKRENEKETGAGSQRKTDVSERNIWKQLLLKTLNKR